MSPVLQAFPGITPHYLLWECTLPQALLWLDRAKETIEGISVNYTITPEEIHEQLDDFKKGNRDALRLVKI